MANFSAAMAFVFSAILLFTPQNSLINSAAAPTVTALPDLWFDCQ
jgi:hypothetical protein